MWNPWSRHLGNTFVGEPSFSIGHEAFWEVAGDDTAPADLRTEAYAALLVLRHFEIIYQQGIHEPVQADGDDDFMLARIRQDVAKVGNRRVRDCLNDTLSALRTEAAIVPDALVTYAKNLEDRGQWRLGYEVWTVIIAAWRRANQPCSNGCIEAYLTRALLARQLGDREAALCDYVIAQDCAANAGFFAHALRAVIGGAHTIGENGSPLLALSVLRAAVRMAQLSHLGEHEMQARNAAGYVLHRAEDPVHAIAEFSAAYELALEQRNVEAADLSLANLAACAADQGYWTLAVDANELITKTSLSIYAKSTALCNLIELYMWLRKESQFHASYERFNQLSMTGHVAAVAQLYHARGMAAFAVPEGVLPIRPRHETMAEYVRAAQVISALGDTTVYTTLCTELAAIASGQPTPYPVPTEVALPPVLLPLHQLVYERLAASAA